ncbi:MAG: glycosyltransferase [Monoglobales bacterium]
MKVCVVVLNSIWYDPRVRKQIIEYKNEGIDVCCVGLKCSRYDEKKVAEIPCSVNIVKINSNYDGKQNSAFGKLKREMLRNSVVRDAIIETNPDIIHANDLNALIPAYKSAKKLGCKLIYDSHEIFIESYTSARNMPYYIYLEHTEKKLVTKVDKMVCVSHAAADYFAKKYKIPTPLVVTNCSLKSEQFIGTEKNEGFEVLNHGGFYEGRGYDIMVESIPLLKDYPEIRLAIRGMGRLEKPLRDRVAELGGNFRFYPPVLVGELIPSASASMVGVAITEAICLNFKLSVSNKLFEYASAGLPVIMSDIPEHRYLNNKYGFGIILRDNTPKTFAEAVIRLYTDKDLYKTCAENAIKLSQEINWENEFRKLIEIEKSLIQEN